MLKYTNTFVFSSLNRFFALTLQQLGCARQFEKLFSLCPLALTLQKMLKP